MKLRRTFGKDQPASFYRCLCNEVFPVPRIHSNPNSIKIKRRGRAESTPSGQEAADIRSARCCLPLSIIFRYLVNRYRLVNFRTTFRSQLVPAEDEIGGVVAAARMAPAAGHTLVPHQSLQETQSFERQADGGLGHI